MRVPRIAVLAAAVMTACVLAMAVPAAAAEPERALVRVAHFSPDASYVDVYMVSLNRRQLFPNVFYKSVSAYWPVAAGPFTYEVRAAGAAPESKPVIQVRGNLAAARAYTAAAVGRRDRLQGVLLGDDLSPSAPGKAKVRFLDAALDLPSVDFAVAGGPVLERRVGFREPTGYRQLASGAYRVEARRSGAEAVLARGRVGVRPRTVTSVVLVGGPGSPVSCTPSAMPPGPGRRRPAASAPGRAGPLPPPAPRPPRCPYWPAPSWSSGWQWRPGRPGTAPGPGVAPRPGSAPGPSGVSPRPRPRRLSLAVTLTAALALVLGGCAQAVDNQEHPEPPSATLPLRGPRQPEPGFPHAQQRGPGSPHTRRPGAGLPHAQRPGPGFPHTRQPEPRSPEARQPAPRSLHTLGPSSGTFDAPALPPQAPGFEVGELPRRVADSEAAAPPVRLEVPAIGVAARVVRLGLGPGGAMQVPGDFGAVGWFAGGPVPGRLGPAVIAGHVDSRSGPAVFYRLRELRPGDLVVVERADGTRLRFLVERVDRFPKAGFPTAAVFGPVPSAALRLITCAGDFDRASGHYLDNLVVSARLAGEAVAARTRDDAGMRTRAGRRRSRPRRLLYGAVAVVVVLGLAFFAGGGWFYTGQIRDGALASEAPGTPALQSPVLAVGGGSITLGRDPGSPRELTLPGTWGLRWAAGYGRLGAIRSLGADRVERAFTRLEGTPPRVGERTAVDGYAWPADPSLAAGRPAREVTYPSPLGPAPAWLVGGRRGTWVILVHGYNAARTETLRTLATVTRQGYPALAIAYRNDPGAPRSPDGLRRWGATEWRDVEAATRYALGRGATGVVLAGYSMGGAVVTSFLLESPLAARVRGVVLDAPALDLGAVIDNGAADRHLPLLGAPVPPALTEVAKGIAGLRYDLDWGRLDYVDRAGRLAAPMLVFHQTGDPRVPVAISEALAAARPDLVTLERFGGDGHVQSWNVDRPRYERAVRAFLERVAPAAAA